MVDPAYCWGLGFESPAPIRRTLARS